MTCILRPGDVLHPITENLASANGFYTFGLQGDGNAVIYVGGIPIWATNTEGTSVGSLNFQYDGNFVLYDSQGKSPWATGTNPKGAGGTIILQDDGNLVLYSAGGEALWASGPVFELVSVEGPLTDFVFDLDNSKLAPPTVVDSFPQFVCNASNEEQNQEVGFDFTYTDTRTFSASFGISIGASVEADVGLPLVVEGKVTVSAEVSTSLTWGQESSESVSKSATTRANVPAKSKMKILPYVTQTAVTVPFTCKAVYNLHELLSETKIKPVLPFHGTYTGQHDFSLNVTFGESVPLAQGEVC